MHWMVVSGETEMYSGNDIEPPEYGCCVAFVEAGTPGKAKAAALKTDEFGKWREWHDGNPFKGLTASPTICPHGLCWCDICWPEGTEYEWEFSACPECEAEMREHAYALED